MTKTAAPKKTKRQAVILPSPEGAIKAAKDWKESVDLKLCSQCEWLEEITTRLESAEARTCALTVAAFLIVVLSIAMLFVR